jgi:hypothetical protein
MACSEGTIVSIFLAGLCGKKLEATPPIKETLDAPYSANLTDAQKSWTECCTFSFELILD